MDANNDFGQDITGYDFIPYPMVTDYAKNWGLYEIPRELVSNARDTLTAVKAYLQDGNYIVEDSGPGILPKHLLLGKSIKLNNDAIGQFGEGLKLAFLVCLRMGLRGEIFSHNYHYVLGRSVMAEEEVLSIAYKYNATSYFEGTRIVIHGWNDRPIFTERFLFNESNENNYVHYNEHGGLLKKAENLGKIFVRGVYVMDSPIFNFGWNLNDVTMVKGRSTLQDYDILRNMGEIMGNCTDYKTWALFFQSLKHNSNTGESNICNMGYLSSDVRDAIKTGFKAVFGNVILGTTRSMMNQAVHLGQDCIFGDIFGQELRNRLADIVGYDEAFVIKKLGQAFEVISSHKINDNQKLTLKYIRKIADKLDFDRKKIKIAGYGCEFLGLCDYNKDTIFLKDTMLENLSKSIGVFIHEVAHYNTHAEDLTDRHTSEIERLSGLIIAGYMKHGI